MSIKLTKNQVLERVYTLSSDFHNVVTETNDCMYDLFNHIDSLSTLLPSHLNNLSVLSDMVTDALVITGSSSLSKSTLGLKEVSNTNVNFDILNNSLQLKTKNKYIVPILKDKSYIKSDNNYLTYSSDGSTLLNFSDLLSGNSALLRSSAINYRYTFCLQFDGYIDINSLNLKLNLNTESYPLLSELYYLTQNNKKEYITILNSSNTSLNLDDTRVKDNSYNIIFDTVKTDRIYFTLEDRDKSDLLIDSIVCSKLDYEAEGELILGPIKSTYPILKASLEAKGDTANALFYLSYNKTDWERIILPTEINKSSKTSKIVSYNTVSNNSIKTNGDVLELYLKIVLNRKKITEATTTSNIKNSIFYTNVYSYPEDNVITSTVYKATDNIFYGSTSFNSNYTTTTSQPPQISHIISDSIYKVRGFITTNNSTSTKDNLTNVTFHTNPLKVNGDNIPATSFNPATTNIYGYVIKNVTRTFNTLTDSDAVLPLSDKYSKDIYTIRQDNNEVKVDLSLGYISSSLNVLVAVVPDKTVSLHDSTGKIVKLLTPFVFNNINYISLIRDGLFTLPSCSDSTLTFNDLHPLKLNSDTEYGLLDNKFICIKSLISFTNYSSLYTEKIDYKINLSKENGNTITITNPSIRDKYTESTTEIIEAFSQSRAIKLKNKHIKKGSLRIKQK